MLQGVKIRVISQKTSCGFLDTNLCLYVNVVVQMILGLVHKSKKVARRPVRLAFGVEFLVYRHPFLELKISLNKTQHTERERERDKKKKNL